MENIDDKKTILIVDDEKPIVDILVYNLEKEGYKTLEANDGVAAVEIATNQKPDLILLDIMLPKMDGLTVCKKIRSSLNVPILMLTAKDEEIDKILGLEMGADDYITKPFAIEELLARIRVALKLHGTGNAASNNAEPEQKEGVLTWNELVLDEPKHKVTYSGRKINLTNREFIMLKVLLENRDIVLSRDTLLEKVCGYDYMGETNVVDVYVRFLRSKIDEEFGVKMIQTVRGVGYVIKSE